MANNTIKTNNIIPTDFEGIKSKVIEKLIERGYDANQLGSNANLLSDILSYLVYSLNVNTAFNVGEMLLPTAQYRKNILHDARLFGYEAERKSSYQYKITLKAKKDETLGDGDTTKRQYSIPKYVCFLNGDKKYYYLDNTLSVELSNKDITQDGKGEIPIIIKEGDLKLYKDNEDTQVFVLGAQTSTSQVKISFPYTNVEKNGTEVFMTYFDKDKDETITDELWELSKRFMIDADTDIIKKYFELTNIKYGTLDILFKIANIGNNLLPNSQAKVNILLTNGVEGVATAPNFDIGNENVTDEFKKQFEVKESYEIVKFATNEESNESIKENAPIFHNSANRAVTARDYIAICNRFTNIYESFVWGGDEERGVAEEYAYIGHIFFSFIPEYRDRGYGVNDLKNVYSLNKTNDTWYIPLSEIENTVDGKGDTVFDILDSYKVMTMQLHYREPIYIDFNYKVRVVKYPLSISPNETHEMLFNSTNKFFEDNIEFFEATYFHSNLVKRLDALLNDNSGIQVELDMKIPLYKRNVEAYVNGGKSILIYFNLPFENIRGAGDEVITDVLPDITTPNFMQTGNELKVDYGTKKGSFNAGLITYDIKLNGVVKGKYYIFYGNFRYILVQLDIASDAGAGALNNETPQYLNLKTPASNIIFNRNCIGRLNSVEFVSESEVLNK